MLWVPYSKVGKANVRKLVYFAERNLRKRTVLHYAPGGWQSRGYRRTTHRHQIRKRLDYNDTPRWVNGRAIGKLQVTSGC